MFSKLFKDCLVFNISWNIVIKITIFIISKWNVFIRYFIKNSNNFSLLTVVMKYIRVKYKNIQNI
jgi:hypothetical protein